MGAYAMGGWVSLGVYECRRVFGSVVGVYGYLWVLGWLKKTRF